MRREYRKWWSPALERDMELLAFGDGGTPVLVFPTSQGRFYQWEDFGLVDHLAGRVDGGWLQLWCVDSVDAESFYAKRLPPRDRARRHLAYERYLLEEAVPAIRADNATPFLIGAGASFGASHVAMLLTRHPGLLGKAVCLSGAYRMSRWLGGELDGDGYFIDPFAFLPGLSDRHYLEPLRRTQVVIATGAEDANVEDSRGLAALLQDKGAPAELHVWPGWAHDWPYWKEMLDAFL